MILLDPIDDGSDMSLTPDELRKVELRVLEEETKNAAVEKDTWQTRKNLSTTPNIITKCRPANSM